MTKKKVMEYIKQYDQELAEAQKDTITYEGLKRLFTVSQKQAHYMIMYLDKSESELLTLEESQFELEGHMLGEEEEEEC